MKRAALPVPLFVPDTAANIRIIDTLPPGCQFVSATGASFDGTRVTWDVSTLAPGAAALLAARERFGDAVLGPLSDFIRTGRDDAELAERLVLLSPLGRRMAAG